MPRRPPRHLGALVLVVALSAGCGSGAGHGSSPPSTSRPAAAHPTTPAPLRPAALVAISTAGDLDVLDPGSGQVERTLATGAVGDELSVTPDGKTVYFEEESGCDDEIESVPVSGGMPTVVTTGSHPVVSPDGTELAFTREPVLGRTPDPCAGNSAETDPASFAVVVRNLSTGQEHTLPASPQVVADGLPRFVSHLSWASDNRHLALSFPAVQDNEGWALSVLDSESATYYTDGTEVPVAAGGHSYYREGVYTPVGDLFVNVVCCSGLPEQVTSSLIDVVSPGSGAVLHQVAVGFTNVDHMSFDVDRSGDWYLYVSGTELYVSEDAARPTPLASGYVAATW